MGRINKYSSKSNLMNILIRYNNEKFQFNLFKETVINEDNITEELKDQPSSYSFLTMLHKGLLKQYSGYEILEKKAYAHAYLKHKEANSPITGRVNSDDVAKQKAELDMKYLKAQRASINAKYEVNVIGDAIKAFEQRKDMLQTLSANRRKERE